MSFVSSLLILCPVVSRRDGRVCSVGSQRSTFTFAHALICWTTHLLECTHVSHTPPHSDRSRPAPESRPESQLAAYPWSSHRPRSGRGPPVRARRQPDRHGPWSRPVWGSAARAPGRPRRGCRSAGGGRRFPVSRPARRGRAARGGARRQGTVLDRWFCLS